MQVSEKERELLLQNLRKELISIVAGRIVHPDTNRLFPQQTIEEAIEELGFDVKINDSAKKQANFLIKELAKRYVIKKADMEIKVSIREEWVSTGVDAGEDIIVAESKNPDEEGDDAGEMEDKPHGGADNKKKDKKPKVTNKKDTKQGDKKHKSSQNEDDADESAVGDSTSGKPTGRSILNT